MDFVFDFMFPASDVELLMQLPNHEKPLTVGLTHQSTRK